MRPLTRSGSALQLSFFRTRRRLHGSTEFLIPIPEGEANPTFYPHAKCKVWGMRGQVVNGPGDLGVAALEIQNEIGDVIASMPFDTTAPTPTPKAVVNAAFQQIDLGQGIYVVRADVEQAGWILIRLAFDDQVGPT